MCIRDRNDAVEALQAKVGVDGSAVTGSLDYKVANQGLVLVKSVEVSGVSVVSVTITYAFSSQFTQYRIVSKGLDTSGNDLVYMELGAGLTHTTFYYGVETTRLYNTGVTDTGKTNGGPMIVCQATNTSSSDFIVDIFSPELPRRTSWVAMGGGLRGVYTNGWYNAGTQFTSVTFQVVAPAYISNAAFYVYGYNEGV